MPPLNSVLPPSARSAIHHPCGEFMFPVPRDLWSVICCGPGGLISRNDTQILFHPGPLGLKWPLNLISFSPWQPLTEFAGLLPGTRRVFQNLNHAQEQNTLSTKWEVAYLMMRRLCVQYCYCSNIMRNKPYKFDKLNTIFNLVLQKLSSKQNSLFVHRCIKTTLHWLLSRRSVITYWHSWYCPLGQI